MVAHFIIPVTCQPIIKIIYTGPVCGHYTHRAKNRCRVFIFILIVGDLGSREKLIAIISKLKCS